MKKVLIVLSVILLTGCGIKKKVDKKIEETDKNLIDTNGEVIINNENVLNRLTIVDKESLIAQVGLSTDKVDSFFVLVSPYDEIESYIAIKPKEEYNDLVTQSLDLYLLKKSTYLKSQLIDGSQNDYIRSKLNMLNNCLKTEYNGYKIYIISNNNEASLESLKKYL